MHLRFIVSFISIVTSLAAAVPHASGQQFYSYLDKTGARVFTNIPPVEADDVPESVLQTLNQEMTSQSPVPEAAGDPNAYDSIIRKYAKYYELDPSLIHSIIATESNFNPNAISTKGAQGLMQLMPETAEQLGVEDSFDPDQNIRAGVKHFRSLMDIFNNDIDLSLAAYNAGENLVRRLGRIPAYKETIDYVRSVTRRYKERRKYAQSRGETNDSPTIRYVDATGVLHLTNIPPSN